VKTRWRTRQAIFFDTNNPHFATFWCDCYPFIRLPWILILTWI